MQEIVLPGKVGEVIKLENGDCYEFKGFAMVPTTGDTVVDTFNNCEECYSSSEEASSGQCWIIQTCPQYPLEQQGTERVTNDLSQQYANGTILKYYNPNIMEELCYFVFGPTDCEGALPLEGSWQEYGTCEECYSSSEEASSNSSGLSSADASSIQCSSGECYDVVVGIYNSPDCTTNHQGNFVYAVCCSGLRGKSIGSCTTTESFGGHMPIDYPGHYATLLSYQPFDPEIGPPTCPPECGGSSSQEPSSAVQEPSSAVQEPSSAVQEPSSAVQEPSSAVQEPSSAVQEAPSAVQEASPSVQEASPSVQEPSLAVQEASSAVQEPSSGIESDSSAGAPLECCNTTTENSFNGITYPFQKQYQVAGGGVLTYCADCGREGGGADGWSLDGVTGDGNQNISFFDPWSGNYYLFYNIDYSFSEFINGVDGCAGMMFAGNNAVYPVEACDPWLPLAIDGYNDGDLSGCGICQASAATAWDGTFKRVGALNFHRNDPTTSGGFYSNSRSINGTLLTNTPASHRVYWTGTVWRMVIKCSTGNVDIDLWTGDGSTSRGHGPGGTYTRISGCDTTPTLTMTGGEGSHSSAPGPG